MERVIRWPDPATFLAMSALSFVAGNGPSSVAVADLDGDTAPDLVTANAGSNDVSSTVTVAK